jgi:molecular chaperone GrpE
MTENEKMDDATEAPGPESGESVKEPSEEQVAAEAEASEEPEAASAEGLPELQQQFGELQDRYMRLNAEFENYKKRMARESSERLKYSSGELIKELLPSLDNLERAIDHAWREESSRESMIEGLEMVFKMAQESLSRFGVSRIDASGELFDPNLHQAVGMVEEAEVPENHVAEQLQAGYLLYDRVLRPSMVRVSGKA